jgi:hypothetical protein
MTQKQWTPAEQESLKQIFRYGAWILGTILTTLIVVTIIASVFNLQVAGGTATSTPTADTLTVTPVTR